MALPTRAFMWRFMVTMMLATLICGCTSVQPWERGTLAKKQMELNPRPLHSKLRQHLHHSREAASGEDTAAAGGGCGCY